MTAITLAAWSGNGKPLPVDLYLLILAMAFAAYFFVCKVAFRTSALNSGETVGPGVGRTMLVVAIAARLIMFAAPHRINGDVSRYVWDGYLVTNGINPYKFAPSDPELLQFQSNHRFEQLNTEFNQIKTVYGPVAMVVFATANLIGGDPENDIRLLMVIGDVVAIYLLGLVFRRTGRSEVWLLLYAMNPLLIESFAERGQMEGVIVPLIAATIYCVASRRMVFAGTFIALAAAAKIHLVLLLPIIFVIEFAKEKENGLKVVAGFGATLSICAIPYLTAWPNSISGILEFGATWQANNSLFSMAKSIMGEDNARWFVVIAFIGVYSAVLYRCKQNGRDRVVQYAEASMLTFVALLVLSPAVFPWYLTWCLPFLPVIACRPQNHWLVVFVALWSSTVLLWYLKFLIYDDATSYFSVTTSSAKQLSDYLKEPWRIVEYGLPAIASLFYLMETKKR